MSLPALRLAEKAEQMAESDPDMQLAIVDKGCFYNDVSETGIIFYEVVAQ